MVESRIPLRKTPAEPPWSIIDPDRMAVEGVISEEEPVRTMEWKASEMEMEKDFRNLPRNDRWYERLLYEPIELQNRKDIAEERVPFSSKIKFEDGPEPSFGTNS